MTHFVPPSGKFGPKTGPPAFGDYSLTKGRQIFCSSLNHTVRMNGRVKYQRRSKQLKRFLNFCCLRRKTHLSFGQYGFEFCSYYGSRCTCACTYVVCKKMLTFTFSSKVKEIGDFQNTHISLNCRQKCLDNSHK